MKQVFVWFITLLLMAGIIISATNFHATFPYYDTDLAGKYSRTVASFAHFDGIHYLRIATRGYADWGSQAFFPVYPLLIRIFSEIGLEPLFSGIFISIISLSIGMFGAIKLNSKQPFKLWGILVFPTAFFFVLVYTESLFFALSIWFFVFLKQKKFFISAVIAGIASGTRLAGTFLLIPFVYEIIRDRKFWLVFLTPLTLSGFAGYTLFLNYTVGDPLAFFHVQSLFGAGRSSSELILLPQVIYRYFKMITTVNPSTIIFQRLVFELATFCFAVFMLIRKWRSMSFAIVIYIAFSLVVPTLTGTLSSIPRYVLVIMPWLLPSTKRGIILYCLFMIPAFIWGLANYLMGNFIS